MDARSHVSKQVRLRATESGQSMVEFAFLVPLIALLILLLVQVEMAISGAIVNLKYSRGTLHFLLFNNRQYPSPSFLQSSNGPLRNRWWVGVSDELVDEAEPGPPKAPKIRVGTQKAKDDEAAGVDGFTTRQNVRIRQTAFICAPSMGKTFQQYFSNSPVGNENALSEQTFLSGAFRFCSN